MFIINPNFSLVLPFGVTGRGGEKDRPSVPQKERSLSGLSDT